MHEMHALKYYMIWI